MPKDLFSKQAQGYARYRPTYPEALYHLIYSHCQSFYTAWDCATGNGQVANELKLAFRQVIATDISDDQLSHAIPSENVKYLIAEAECTPFEDATFDLITVGQALHWFEIERFFKEAQRVLKPNGVLAFWGYGFFKVDRETDPEIKKLREMIHSYWDEVRNLVDTAYESIRSPFTETPFPQMNITRQMNLKETANYLRTWSGVQKFIEINQYDPVDKLEKQLAKTWGPEQVKTITHPLFGRICKHRP